mmetsp:Transcript_19736/g.28388  ORF Transcript_19736/g.28388 Transcript_19736/m.28388 type:complete len:724 (-) Transcript_19736:65-2236(-)|eukprot:CAMPEP_0185020840 /NCGR_PEP_ID=MMETSP1103-20130426/3484_1 /TAXON_ID=36769 /ORGANISM="Paraphysomonas bandaiensis, Strain Caron Lab Isolate" /LENGTH=723 /DNA_ID=CAMNT_0027551991 /DNA_START=79 /DNA_END=2250 /DNA_ORIENTATION=-
MAADLQYMFTQPRDKSASRVASSFVPSKTTGEDGKLYMLADKEDAAKFKTLSDEEIQEEQRVSEKMKESILANSKNRAKIDSHGFPRKESPQKTVPKKQPKKRQSSTSHHQTSDMGSTHMDSALLNETAKAVTKTIGEDDDRDTSMGPPEDKLLRTVSTMQEKYAENLKIIEKLFKERQEMEKRLEYVEKQLKQSRRSNNLHKKLRQAQTMSAASASREGFSVSQPKETERLNKTAPVGDLNELLGGGDECFPDTGANNANGMSFLPPMGGDECLPGDEETETATAAPPPGYNDSSVTSGMTETSAKNAHPALQESIRSNNKYSDEPASIDIEPQIRPTSARSPAPPEIRKKKTTRPMSANNLTFSHTRSQPSPAVTAQMDRFHHKRVEIEEEKQQRLLEKKIAEDIEFEKEHMKYLEEDAKRKEKQQRFLNRIRKSADTYREWSDIKREDEEKRKRHEKRREHHFQKWLEDQKKAEDRRNEAHPLPSNFKAEDPVKVKNYLETQREKWDKICAEEEAKRKAREKLRKVLERKFRRNREKARKEWLRQEKLRKEAEAKALQEEAEEREKQYNEITQRAKAERDRVEALERIRQQESQRRREIVTKKEAAAREEERKREREKLLEERKERALEKQRKVEAEKRKKEALKKILHGSVPESSLHWTQAATKRAETVRKSLEKKAIEEKRKEEEEEEYERKKKQKQQVPQKEKPFSLKDFLRSQHSL